MFIGLTRFLYSLSYFTLILAFWEIKNIADGWNDICFYWNPCLTEGLRAFVVIHYPAILFVVILGLCKYTLSKGSSTLTRNQLKGQKSKTIGLGSTTLIGQLIPLATQLKDLGAISSSLTMCFIMPILWLLYTTFGSLNPSLYILRYHQYRISTDSSDYWLISRRKIRNFSQSFAVVEISNGIMLRV